MSYKVDIEKIWDAHGKAWNALVGKTKHDLTWPQIDTAYRDKYHAKLIRGPDARSNYKYIEFKSKAAYVLFMLEWS